MSSDLLDMETLFPWSTDHMVEDYNFEFVPPESRYTEEESIGINSALITYPYNSFGPGTPFPYETIGQEQPTTRPHDLEVARYPPFIYHY